MDKEQWQKLQDYADNHKDLLVMFACPKDDSILISFGGVTAFVRFPMESMDKGVIFNALRESKFSEAIDPLMAGIMKATQISDKKEGGEVLKVLGGAIRGIGIQRTQLKTNLQKNGKTKKG